MRKGIIIKGIGGFYYVKEKSEIFECRARGKFRNDKITPLVGDYVMFSVDDLTGQGIIEKIIERKVELIRPQVANVDQAIIVISAKNPSPNLQLLDKLLILGEYSNLNLCICINKIDLDDEGFYRELADIYKNTNYNIIPTSTKKLIGLDNIRETLKNKITVFAGPSGVGKSSILNAIQKGLKLKTGDLSKKINRGKHTTRHSELLELDFGGLVVDTPGFTSLNIDFIPFDELSNYYPDFLKAEKCRFDNCLHIDEPDCSVKDAVIKGYISIKRYNNYVSFVKNLKSLRNRRY